MTSRILAVLLSLGLVSCAVKAPVKVGLTAYVGASVADTAITLDRIDAGVGSEANPLFKPFVNHPVLFTLVRMVPTIVITYAVARFGTRHPQLAAVVSWIAAGSVSWVAYHNFRVGR